MSWLSLCIIQNATLFLSLNVVLFRSKYLWLHNVYVFKARRISEKVPKGLAMHSANTSVIGRMSRTSQSNDDQEYSISITPNFLLSLVQIVTGIFFTMKMKSVS